MRILAVVAVLLLVAVAGGLLAAPRLIDWEDYRRALTRQAEVLTGGTVTIEGRIALSFLPQPTLTLAGTTFVPRLEAAHAIRLEVDRLDVQLKPLTLLRGEPEVEAVRLVRPVLQFQGAGEAALAELFGLGALPLSRFSVVDGRAVLRAGDGPPARQLERINLDATASAPGRPLDLAGRFELANQSFSVAARLGRFVHGPSTTLQLQLAAENATGKSTDLSVSGVIALDAGRPRLAGAMTLTGEDTEAALLASGALLGSQALAMSIGINRPFSVSGRVDAAPGRLRIDQLQLDFAGATAHGRLDLRTGPAPSLDLNLQVPELAVADPVGLTEHDLSPLAALSPALTGRIDVTVGALAYRDDQVRRIRLVLSLRGEDGIRFEQARAILPGQTDLSFEGELRTVGHAPRLLGELDAVTHDFGQLLTWLDLRPPEIANGRLQTLNLSSRIAGDAEGVRLTGLDLRIDASHLTGALAISLAPQRQIAAVLAVDRLDLDAYRPDLTPEALLEAVRRQLGAVDAAAQVRIARLMWRGVRLQDVTLDARSVDGRVDLNELAVGEVAAGRGQMAGSIDLIGGEFELTAGLETARPGRLLRELGFEPPTLLARLTPIQLNATAKGRAQAFDLDLQLGHEQAHLALAGPVSWTDDQLRYTLEVAATHPDYGALLERLGAPPPGLAAGTSNALSLTGTLRSPSEVDLALVGNATFGPMSLTGGFTWRKQPERPLVNVRLSVGEPHRGMLVSVLALLGLSLDPTLIAGSFLGNWPRHPLGLDWLGKVDGEFELSGKGGWAGEGIELAARLDDQRLLVDRFAAELWQGRMDLQASFDLGRPYPFLALALDLEGVDAARLTSSLGVPPVLAGEVDLHAEATAAGSSAHDLVRGLAGEAEVHLRDGRLSGSVLDRVAAALAAGDASSESSGSRAATNPASGALPFSRLGGRFELSRGIATAQSVVLELDAGSGELAGAIDLLLWAADLTLQVQPAGPEGARAVGLRIVGPLDGPHARVLLPDGPSGAAAPGPGP